MPSQKLQGLGTCKLILILPSRLTAVRSILAVAAFLGALHCQPTFNSWKYPVMEQMQHVMCCVGLTCTTQVYLFCISC